MEKNHGINISVQGGGSGVGIASLLDKTTDIANSSRRIKAEEVAKAKASGVNPNEIPIALDGIAVVVHPGNPVKALTRAQIKAIYTAKSPWSEVGEKRKTVTVSRIPASGLRGLRNVANNKKGSGPDALTTAPTRPVAQIIAQTPAPSAMWGTVTDTQGQGGNRG
jgi:phosphate transport system substrate-binding protein